MKDLITLITALCFAEFVHNVVEIWGMRQKVQWLKLSMSGRPHGHWPINIDSKTKTILLHFLILFVIGGSAFVILKLMHLQETTLLITGISVFLINYIYVTWRVDCFHAEIGELIKKGE